MKLRSLPRYIKDQQNKKELAAKLNFYSTDKFDLHKQYLEEMIEAYRSSITSLYYTRRGSL